MQFYSRQARCLSYCSYNRNLCIPCSIRKVKKGGWPLNLMWKRPTTALISWTFLEVVICKISFNSSLVSLIKFCKSSASLSVFWNGEPLDCFTPSCGLRQGDPLFPYLFVLCMESLITQSIANEAWHPLKTKKQSMYFSFIFCQWFVAFRGSIRHGSSNHGAYSVAVLWRIRTENKYF